jgi:hypothetical protein
VENAIHHLNVPEAFFEHRQSFAQSWADRWTIPNPFVTPLYELLQTSGVELTDLSFNKDAATVGDHFLNVAIRNLNAAVRIGLNSVIFSAANPDWESAPELLNLFQAIAEMISKVVDLRPILQETTLALHVVSEGVDLGRTTASFVDKEKLGEATFYGVSLHRQVSSLFIDKSVRYSNAAFIRIQRRSSGDASFATVASGIYEEEVFALRLLGMLDQAGDPK